MKIIPTEVIIRDGSNYRGHRRIIENIDEVVEPNNHAPYWVIRCKDGLIIKTTESVIAYYRKVEAEK